MSPKHTLSDDEKATFKTAMEGSKPWDDAPDDRVSQVPPEAKSWFNLDYLPKSNWVNAKSVIQFARPHIQEKQLHQLATGKLRIDQKIDLHGYTTHDLYEQLDPMIHQAQESHHRILLIIHGKGDTDSGQSALLKNYLNQSLREHASVLAFHSAKPAHGGTGALYVLLKKRSGHV